MSLQAKKFSTSTYALIGANLVPLVGLLFFNWSLFSIMLLFWAENVVIGFYNVVRILYARGGAQQVAAVRRVANTLVAVFFTFHYGIFTLVHGMFVYALFRSDDISMYGIVIGVLSLVLSHGISLQKNYFGSGLYKTTSADVQMKRPYRRVVVLHLTIIFGGMLLLQFGAPVAVLLLLIVLKMGVDLAAHLRVNNKP